GMGIRGRRLNAALSPVGEPFQINQSFVGDQQRPAVALLKDGGFVTVYESGKPGAQNVYARFLSPSAAFTTDEILVNYPAFAVDRRITTNWTLVRNNKLRPRTQKIREIVKNREEFNSNPRIAVLNDGSVVVVYDSSRKLNVKSFTLSEQVKVNRKGDYVTNRTRVPLSLAYDYMADVYLQRLSAAGQKLGDEIVVHDARQFNQRGGSVAALNDGRFVVCWTSEVPGRDETVDSRVTRFGSGRSDVFIRVFGADGTPAGPEIRINTTNLPCSSPAVTGRNAGGFTVAWIQQDGLRDNGTDVWFRSFDAGAAPAVEPVRANAELYGDQFAPVIAAVGNRELLAWSSMGQDGSWEGVYARLLDGGSLGGAEFCINTTKYLRQINPAVSSSGTQAVVVWSGFGFDHGFDVLGQRYQLP
ncbi:MAG TPA: hypothetical protein VNT99_01795, partial [Methylomirabilota bacterium]|nr:hypothetical protein [Methylomirabilota bacterium]